MRRPKYHFLVVKRFTTGKSFITLPGQTFGQNPVPAGQLVRDVKGRTELARARKGADDGDVFFTTSLRQVASGLTAGDIHRLGSCDDLMLQDAESEYQRYLSENPQ